VRKDSLVQGATTKRILSFATMILLMSTCSAIFVIPLKDDPEMPDYLKNLETYQLNPQAYLGNKEVYGFGVVVRDLPKCTDSDFIQGLTDLLLEYHFNISYSTRGPSWTSKPRDKYNSVTFDCSDMSRATWRLLKEYGYDARLMMGQTKQYGNRSG